MFFNSPLEQFQLYPLLKVFLFNFDLSLTNASFILLIGVLSLGLLTKFIYSTSNSFYIIPKVWHSIIDIFYTTIVALVKDNVGKKGQVYVPFIFTLFLFIVISNVIGLVPYSFTVTSHLIMTFGVGFSLVLGISLQGIKEHNWDLLTLFLPSGTSLGLALLLVPIEIISYLFKPISLSVRLFANMMAGHTLLKVIAGFAWTMMMSTGVFLLLHTLPLAILFLLVGLEIGVAFIQAYVFTILTCIYLNDSLNLH